jgi:hypothetical protein
MGKCQFTHLIYGIGRMPPFKCARFLAKGNDFKAESVVGTEEGAEKGEEFSNKYIVSDL